MIAEFPFSRAAAWVSGNLDPPAFPPFRPPNVEAVQNPAGIGIILAPRKDRKLTRAEVIDKLERGSALGEGDRRFLLEELNDDVPRKPGRSRDRGKPSRHKWVTWLVLTVAERFDLPIYRNETSAPHSACDAVAEAMATSGRKPGAYGSVKNVVVEHRQTVQAHKDRTARLYAMLSQPMKTHEELMMLVTQLTTTVTLKLHVDRLVAECENIAAKTRETMGRLCCIEIDEFSDNDGSRGSA